MNGNYWICVLNRGNWSVVKEKGIWGVSKRHANQLKKTGIGELVAFYLLGEQTSDGKMKPAIGGIGEITSKPYKDEAKLFLSNAKGELYPYRVKINKLQIPQEPLRFKELLKDMDFIKNKTMWGGHFFGKAMRKIPKEDFEKIILKLDKS